MLLFFFGTLDSRRASPSNLLRAFVTRFVNLEHVRGFDLRRARSSDSRINESRRSRARGAMTTILLGISRARARSRCQAFMRACAKASRDYLPPRQPNHAGPAFFPRADRSARKRCINFHNRRSIRPTQGFCPVVGATGTLRMRHTGSSKNVQCNQAYNRDSQSVLQSYAPMRTGARC